MAVKKNGARPAGTGGSPIYSHHRQIPPLSTFRQPYQRWAHISIKTDLEHRLDIDFDQEILNTLDSTIHLLEVLT